MIEKDLKRYSLKRKSLFIAWLSGNTFFAVFNYRVSNYLFRKGVKILPSIIKFRTMRRYGCEISPYAKIGGGLFLPHSLGIIIGHQVEIGNNCEIFQNVTIGTNRKENKGRSMPCIGSNVSIGNGAIIVGPITIGDNVVIGAQSYVDKDIPSGVFVLGSPARIIKTL